MKRPLTKLGPSSRFALVLALLLLLPLLVQQIFLPLIAANEQSHQEAKLLNFIDSLPADLADLAAGQVDTEAISAGCAGIDQQAGISLIPAQGYAGAMQLYAAFGTDGQLRALALAEHRETPGFIDMLQPEWFEQLVDNTNSAQTLDAVSDAVSGATVSSTGIIEALLACLAQRAL